MYGEDLKKQVWRDVESSIHEPVTMLPQSAQIFVCSKHQNAISISRIPENEIHRSPNGIFDHQEFELQKWQSLQLLSDSDTVVGSFFLFAGLPLCDAAHVGRSLAASREIPLVLC